MGVGAITLWGHALAALAFGMLAVSQLRGDNAGLPRNAFIGALAATALWALAVAGIDARDVAARVAESLRNIAWLYFMYALVRDREGRPRGVAVAATYTVVGMVSIAAALVSILEAVVGRSVAATVFEDPRLLLRMMAAVASLVLAIRVARAVLPGAQGGIGMAMAAMAAMWSVDLTMFTSAYLSDAWPAGFVAARGLAMAGLVPILAVAAHRDGDWSLQLSRTAAFGTLSLAALGIYALAMTLGVGLFAAVGGAHARLFQTAFIAGTGASLLALMASPWLRSWMRVKLAKHFFAHRYDYRHEWLRFTAALAHAAEGAAPLDARIARGLADTTESPAALLLVPEGDGLGVGASAGWTGRSGTAGSEFVARLGDGWIVDLDAERAEGRADLPQWLVDEPAAWVVVPLVHDGRLAGAAVLSRPTVARAPDWEDFDMLRVAASQAASYLAEARAHAALAEAQRFDEFNRRFAFIMHDIKNLVSQLTLVARNAERHADNPDFRADMVATLQASCGRMNELLARLSQHHGGRADPPRPTELMPIVRRVAARFGHPVMVAGDPGTIAAVDSARFEQLLGHLVQNAVEASPAAEPVAVALSDDGDQVAVTVTDKGCGMTPAFVRDSLFRPFVSSKDGGFGIGAFEARQLAEAMGGSIAVSSGEGAGSRFTVCLPHAIRLEAAA